MNPCRENGCCACCVETRMTLTNADVARLRRSGAKGFLVRQEDGSIRLRNIDGRCVFLRHGVCAVYPDRPDGCRVYPLVLDVASDRVGVDDFCPYRERFLFNREDEALLRASLAEEEREASERSGR